MSTSLRTRLGDLASTFAASIVDAVRGSSLQELLAQSTNAAHGSSSAPKKPAARSLAAKAPTASTKARPRAGRLPRRSDGDISAVVDQIVELLGRHAEGLRAEQIRVALDLAAKELPRPLKEGLEAGRLAKSGEKRATTYFAKSARTVRSPKAGTGRRPRAVAALAVKASSSREKAEKSNRPTPRDRAPDGAEPTDTANPMPETPAVQDSAQSAGN